MKKGKAVLGYNQSSEYQTLLEMNFRQEAVFIYL